MEEIILYNSPLGIIQISCDEQSVLSVLFVETKKNNKPAELQLINNFPVSIVLKNCMAQLDQFFSGENLHFNLPLMQTGTAFQQTVWSALLSIKPGTTTSYLQLSKRINNVKAIRAVGAELWKRSFYIIAH